MRAGSSPSSSAAAGASPGFGGGPALALGSYETNARSPRMRTNSGFLPTLISPMTAPLAASISVTPPVSRVATTSVLPSVVMPMPRGPFPDRSKLAVVCRVARSSTDTPVFWLVTKA